MKENFNDGCIDDLFEAILSLKSTEECYDFFEDLCTIAELRELSRRLGAAVMLERGGTYEEISSSIGVSTATISRVKRVLRTGNGVYKRVVKTLAEGDK